MNTGSLKRHFYVATAVTAALATAPFSAEQRTRVKDIAKLCGFGNLAPSLPGLPLQRWVQQAVPVRIAAGEGHHYNVSFYELFVIVSLVASRQSRRIMEFGTFDGRTTLNLAMNTPSESVIYTLDLPPDERTLPDSKRVGEVFATQPENTKIRQILESSRTYDFTAHHQSIDFIFIDAGHGYEDVRNDTEKAISLVNPRGGLVVWHDYTSFPGVLRAVEEAARRAGPLRNFSRIAGTCMAVAET